ncbi:unnamed protein product, partial [Coffea canephora]
MAESAVGFLINQLSTLLSQEHKLLGGLKSDVQFIKAELGSMKAFLREAEAKEDNDSQLQEWLKQVREVAYDTEDVLDDFTFRFARFSSSRQANADFDIRAQSLFIEEAQLVGIDKPKAELISKILDDHSQLKVVSVVGMGGLGKTTLVKKVYDDAAVKKQFQSHAWITVSQNFQFSDIIKNLIQQLYNEIRQSPLSDKESWTLFCNRIFQSNDCPTNLEEIAKKVLKKCEGLPLAIVAIGGVLAQKDKENTDEWEMILHGFGGEADGNRIKRVLLLSYNDLPHYLKSCLLYLSIYPEDYPIDVEDILLKWIALGFFLHGDPKLLKVLDLDGAELDSIPKQVFKLFHLRYLNLSGTGVKIIPKSIGKLQNLEVIDLIGTNVTELPAEILNLRKLRSICLGGVGDYSNEYAVWGCKSPDGIGKL